MEPVRGDGVLSIDLAALRSALGEFEVRDEDLVLDPAPRIGRGDGAPRVALYAGIDGERRAVLAITGAGDEAVLLAIDALAWCDAHADLLARRIGAEVTLGTCVVLVLADPAEATLSALAALRSGDLRVFVARSLRSARQGGGDLVEVERRSNADSGVQGAAWDQQLNSDARGLVERVLAGLPRIDPDARAVSGPRSIVWRHGQVALVQLRSAGGRLEVEADGECFAVEREPDVERVLSATLRGYLAVGAAPSETSELATAPPRTSLMPRGPLLSEDELAALRGDA